MERRLALGLVRHPSTCDERNFGNGRTLNRYRETRLSLLYFRVVRHRGSYQNAPPAVPALATDCNSRITQNSRRVDTYLCWPPLRRSLIRDFEISFWIFRCDSPDPSSECTIAAASSSEMPGSAWPA